MPSLISLSPKLSDHSFPKDAHELATVAVGLGKLSELVEKSTVKILATEFFKALLRDFKWDETSAIRNQIFTHLNLWFLNGRSVFVKVSIDDRQYAVHPLPDSGYDGQGLEELWADELGRLLVLHDENAKNGEYFIGIACEKAFAEQKIGKYQAHSLPRCFPLVGPEDCECDKKKARLTNAYEYQPPREYKETEVSFEQAKKHLHVLGATEVRKPKRGSHFKVKFPGARSWVLDPNDDPLPINYLKELEAITGKNLQTIIYSLREGILPPLRLKLST